MRECSHLKRYFIEVESVTFIVVGADSFRVVVDHDGLPAHLDMWEGGRRRDMLQGKWRKGGMEGVGQRRGREEWSDWG